MPKRRGRKSKAQTPAPPKERIFGSKKNPKGSASSEKSASKIRLNKEIINALEKKLAKFKEENPNNKNVTLNDLKAVFRRGLGAYSKSHRPTITGGVPNTRNAWAFARVNKFLKKASGEKVKKAYVQDDDLLKMEKGGLLAPNGKPSNLTPEQYKLVRTPAFKKWFGDWEKKKSKASKVLDSNGEPLVVYHGTNAKFYVFDTDEESEDRETHIWNAEYPDGYIFMTSNKNIAKTYGKRLIPLFVNLRFPEIRKVKRGESLVEPFDDEGLAYEGDAIVTDGIDYIVGTQDEFAVKLADGSNMTFDGSNPDIRFAKGGEVDFDCYEIDVDENIEYAKGGNVEDIEVEKIDKNTYFLSYGNKGYLRLVNEPYSIFSLNDYTDKEGAVKELGKYGIDKGERTWHISLIHVEPKYRGQGVASILLNACIQWAKQNNYKKLVLLVQPQGKGGLSYRDLVDFYSKYKFKKLKKHYGRDWMIRKLAKGGEVVSKDDVDFALYHGTIKEKWKNLNNESYLFVTDEFEIAKNYALEHENGTPIVIKIDPNQVKNFKWEVDCDYSDEICKELGLTTWQDSLNKKGTFAIIGRVNTNDFEIIEIEKDYAKGGEVDKKVLRERWAKKKDALENLANNISRLRKNLSKDLKEGDEKQRLTALVIKIMDETGERVGNDDSADNGHFGVTGLKKKHIKVNGSNVKLKYVGKSGVEHEKEFNDSTIASALKDAIRRSPSEYVFETSEGFRIKNDRVNRYLNIFNVSAKDLRGYSANKWIINKLRSVKDREIINNDAKRKKKFNEIVKSVAEKVGHGSATLKKHYLLPSLEREFVNHGKIVDLSNIKRTYQDGGEIMDEKIFESYMKFAYDEAKELARDNGLNLRDDFAISEGGKFYEPSIVYLHDDKKLEKVAIAYVDDNEKQIGELIFDLEDREIQIYFPNLDVYDFKSYKRGGETDEVNTGIDVINNMDSDPLDSMKDIPGDGIGIFGKGGKN